MSSARLAIDDRDHYGRYRIGWFLPDNGDFGQMLGDKKYTDSDLAKMTAREDRADALGDESEWSNCCDRGEVALELVGQLQADRDSARAEADQLRVRITALETEVERMDGLRAGAVAEVERLQANVDTSSNHREVCP